MGKVKQIRFPRHFTTGELVDIGRRLTKEKLEEMKLLSAVEKAEKENVWRLKAAIELIKPLTHILPEVLLVELERAETQLINPTRGQAIEVGGTPRPGGRTLPKPGTILVSSHGYRFRKTFQFLVVEQPCKLLWLDEPGGPIYRNPSDAASTATKSRVNGWKYFDIK